MALEITEITKTAESPKSTEIHQNGTVKWFNTMKGYGFITPDEPLENGKDIFVHYSSIQVDDSEFQDLNDNDEVEFEFIETERGFEAKNVIITKEAPYESKSGDAFY